MTNRTLYMSVMAFAAAAALSTNAKAQDADFDGAPLMQEIHADLDQQNAAFTLALVEKADAKVQARFAKLQNVFAPLTAPTEYNLASAFENTRAEVEFAALSKAEFEVSKKVANIENPFAQRLPMPPAIIALDNEQY